MDFIKELMEELEKEIPEWAEIKKVVKKQLLPDGKAEINAVIEFKDGKLISQEMEIKGTGDKLIPLAGMILHAVITQTELDPDETYDKLKIMHKLLD